jgi:hypothetical protein
VTLGQLLVLALIVVVFWMGKKLKRHDEKLDKLEKKDKD